MNVKVLYLLFLLPICIHAECTCEEDSGNLNKSNKTQALIFKLIAIASILVAGALGVCIPLFGKMFKSFSTESDFFLLVKFFAAGVILATGFVHVFPDANESLENPCLGDKAWGDFPLANFVAMLAAVTVMMVETMVTSYYNNRKVEAVNGDEEKPEDQMHVHTHSENGHAHGSLEVRNNKIISVVLEIGIITHSVIIGISLGVSVHPETIKPLIVALSFHQMFEGMGLGSCITEAKFKGWKVATMLILFSLTTPIGIAVGIGISNTYDDNSHLALILQGIFNALSAGILIYMALVDLLAIDFMKSKVQKSFKLQFRAFISILLGLGSMSLLAKWA
ncbi:putative zinc/iron permease [Helianthus anomalus]